jgi:hypothetical protein
MSYLNLLICLTSILYVIITGENIKSTYITRVALASCFDGDFAVCSKIKP